MARKGLSTLLSSCYHSACLSTLFLIPNNSLSISPCLHPKNTSFPPAVSVNRLGCTLFSLLDSIFLFFQLLPVLWVICPRVPRLWSLSTISWRLQRWQLRCKSSARKWLRYFVLYVSLISKNESSLLGCIYTFQNNLKKKKEKKKESFLFYPKTFSAFLYSLTNIKPFMLLAILYYWL